MTREEAEALDQSDPLAPLRERFLLPRGVVYLDGNSLGALPAGVPARMRQVVEREWGERLIRSWNESWFEASQRVARALAPIVGALPHEVQVADSTSINLFKLLGAALRLRPERPRIVIDADAFPTNLYLAQSASDWIAGDHTLDRVEADRLEDALGPDVAAVVLSHVDYRSGRLHALPHWVSAAHGVGALLLVDVSHSAGALPLELHDRGIDLAVGCGYKFLNGGPGAPAYAFVREDLQAELEQPLAGWFGHARPFAFEPDYTPAPGMGRVLCGTPPILSLAAFESALELWRDVDLEAVRRKSVALGELLIREALNRCGRHGLELASPRDPEQRASQVSFRHPAGYPIVQALIERGIIGDFRAPDRIRFGIAPLYNRYVDLWCAADALEAVLAQGLHRAHPAAPERPVT